MSARHRVLAQQVDDRLNSIRCNTHGGPDAHLGTSSALDCAACRIECVAETIAHAIEEEREACAKVAMDAFLNRRDRCSGSDCKCGNGGHIAMYIRARPAVRP